MGHLCHVCWVLTKPPDGQLIEMESCELYMSTQNGYSNIHNSKVTILILISFHYYPFLTSKRENGLRTLYNYVNSIGKYDQFRQKWQIVIS